MFLTVAKSTGNRQLSANTNNLEAAACAADPYWFDELIEREHIAYNICI